MPTKMSPLNRLVDILRQSSLCQKFAVESDGHLLVEFTHNRNEAALDVLIRRHAAMVWGVCRRILSDEHDAEDAFQATFLVLVRRVSCINPPELVGNWLYGVACQTARKARATLGKRNGRERQVTTMPERPITDKAPDSDLRAIVDQELELLPDTFRAVMIACDLEGRSRAEVARQLGIAEGTVASRLARARSMLMKRLAGRGITLATGAMIAILGPNVVSAAPPAVLTATVEAASLVALGKSTVGIASAAAIALADAVVSIQLASKAKAALALLLLVGVLGFATAAAFQPAPAASTVIDSLKDDPVERKQVISDKELLRGKWIAKKVEMVGESIEFAEGTAPVYFFGGDTLTVRWGSLSSDGKPAAFANGRFPGRAAMFSSLNPDAKLKVMNQFGGRGGPMAGLNTEQRKVLIDCIAIGEDNSIGVEFAFRMDENSHHFDRFLSIDGTEKWIARGVYSVSAATLQIWESSPMVERPSVEQIQSGTGCTKWEFKRPEAH